uniref:5-oxoprolinase n=1 Tax=Panagrolaimus sp. ES5 TaxID=591445 RepID=A0AC34GWY0_9BILA
MALKKGVGFGIDRGGTFTDVFVVYPDGKTNTFKLLSEDSNYNDAPTEAIRRVLSEYTGKEIPRGSKIPTDNVSFIRMGTTVATNALLERNGEKTALLLTAGFKDLLKIGNQARTDIFDLNIKTPEMLYTEVYEVHERVVLVDETCQMNMKGEIKEASNGQKVIIEQKVDEKQLRLALGAAVQKGIQSIAVALLHSYIYPEHERVVRDIANEFGFSHVSISSDVAPMVKIVPRGFTATADAYLTPIIRKYIEKFCSGFEDNLKDVVVEFMRSDGGLCSIQDFVGSKAILSGPAGGVVGVSYTAYDESNQNPIIAFDMGGTSTDVSRYAGHFNEIIESETDGIIIQSPQLEIHTVAAGGGSRLFFKNGMFVVGPQSSGSTPGPICYRKNGYLSITDANIVLNRIVPEHFPYIFGKTEDQPLDRDAAVEEFKKITEQINKHMTEKGHQKMSMEEVALGFIKVANETMCRPIRRLTEAKGYDTAQHTLACFGGAGGQHACAVARSLGMKKVKIHKNAGVLSAYGLVLADVVVEKQAPVMKAIQSNFNDIQILLKKLENDSKKHLVSQGFNEKELVFEKILHMRYHKTDAIIMCSDQNGKLSTKDDFVDEFGKQYMREFGFTISDREIIVDDVRVRGIGKRYLSEKTEKLDASSQESAKLVGEYEGFFEHGKQKMHFFKLDDLRPGNAIHGPAVIIDKNCTILVEPKCSAEITEAGDVEINVESLGAESLGDSVNSVHLSIFSHRFMSIAEQMGSVLQRSSISTNIKERLDFSCALFGPDGGLVANAPHIPVHLGGMQAAVQYQLNYHGKNGLKPGDVLLSNHPIAGGSHLPDLTVITPVFIGNSKEPDFFVANRGHHADIGGLSPGSMPPHSTRLIEEGAIFTTFKIVSEGKFQEDELIEILKAPGKVPGCAGSRNLKDNLADLRAQIAANQKGINLLEELIKAYGTDTVKKYMAHIQSAAENTVRQMLINNANKFAKSDDDKIVVLSYSDGMDDGSIINLNVSVARDTGDAVFDFTGTTCQVYSSINAPKAITTSAIIYCLRCLLGEDIPLNQGCLASVKIVSPEKTIINPDQEAAVVGGNVQTSQRLCDVVFGAFKAVAASQGCMNNITFGDETMGYYETVAGGAGAGPGYNGRSGVHTHMTNTRITDPEILESRYPVILRKFTLRPNSGGTGKYHGGDGVERYLQFRRPITLTVMTERRVLAPYGLYGGKDGKRGTNILYRSKKASRINLGPKNSVNVEPGDIFELSTPGGGGWEDGH